MSVIRYGKRIISILLAGILLLQLTACAKVHSADLTDGVTPRTVSEQKADGAFIAAMADFAVKLFQNRLLADGESAGENVLMSPLSVMLALAMMANGAEGETRTEMESLLGSGLSIKELNGYLHTYMDDLPSNRDSKLQIANSIWFREAAEFTVVPDFLQVNADYYGAEIRKEPFDESTVGKINGWVKDHTDSMIKEIIREISPDTMMYLINALAFDAKWEEEYEKHNVYDHPFTSWSGETYDVTMMSSTESLYLDDGSAVGFVKPYKGGHYSFAALLPNEGVDIGDYMDSMNGEKLLETINSAMSATVIAGLPEFTCEDDTLLNRELEKLGMPLAFDAERADLSGLGHSSDGNLYIGQVLHKTFISVDRQGTKAAAVTAVEITTECAVEPVDVYYVTLDRPFVYMIVDNATGLPVFIGAAMDIRE